jgi:predicted Zn-dependent protease
LSAQAGFSPELFASCLQRLAKKREDRDPGVPGYLSSHPPDAERIARAHAAALDFERKRAHPAPPASAAP